MAAFQGAAPDDSAVEADIADGGKVLDEVFASSILVIGASGLRGRFSRSSGKLSEGRARIHRHH